jgi:preprotein translocase subunit SecG
MANQPRSRSSRQPSTPQNSQIMGVVLVVVAFVVGLLLLIAGGGTGAAVKTGGSGGTTDGSGTETAKTTTTAPPATTPAANLLVVVGNGSGKSGRAKKTADILVAKGYVNTSAVDGQATQISQVFFIPGAADDANAIAAALGFRPDQVKAMPAPIPLKNPDIGGARVVVLVGPDFDPALPLPTTTAPPA